MLPVFEQLPLFPAIGAGGADIVLDHPLVSRRHAMIMQENGVVLVNDLRSKNGTWVNGLQIRDPVGLQRGDHVRIGHAEFAYTVEGDAYRCASCMQTLVSAPPEAPFCTECRRTFPLLGATLGERRLVRGLGTGSFGSVYVGHRRGNPTSS